MLCSEPSVDWTVDAPKPGDFPGDGNGVINYAYVQTCKCKGRLVKQCFVEISLDWRLHEMYLNFNMTSEKLRGEGGPSQVLISVTSTRTPARRPSRRDAA